MDGKKLTVWAMALGLASSTGSAWATLMPGGVEGDIRTSIVYDAGSGELGVDAPMNADLASILIDSQAGILTGGPAENLEGPFDLHSDSKLFKMDDAGFGSLSFGAVAPPGLSEALVLADLEVNATLLGGGKTGSVDLVYVPEPTTLALLVLGSHAMSRRRRGGGQASSP